MKDPITIDNGIKEVEKVINQNLQNQTIIVQFRIDHIWKCNSKLIKLLQDNDYSGIYITFTKRYSEIAKDFDKMEINRESMIFIDGISAVYGYPEIKKSNVAYIRGPIALKELADKISTLFPTLKSKKKFVFIGSLTTLLLYNQKDKVMEFIKEVNSHIGSENTLLMGSQYCDENLEESVEAAIESNTIKIDLRHC